MHLLGQILTCSYVYKVSCKNKDHKHHKQMSKIQIVSTLEGVIQKAWAEPSLTEARKAVEEHINGSKIKPDDKIKIVKVMGEITSKPKFDFYLANALLKYEGLGVGAKEAPKK